MLSLSKQLYWATKPIKGISTAVELLRQAQHDVSYKFALSLGSYWWTIVHKMSGWAWVVAQAGMAMPDEVRHGRGWRLVGGRQIPCLEEKLG